LELDIRLEVLPEDSDKGEVLLSRFMRGRIEWVCGICGGEER